MEIRLADKLLGTAADETGKGILSLLVVGFHVRLEVVAAAEELATALDATLKICLLLGRMLAWNTPRPR